MHKTANTMKSIFQHTIYLSLAVLSLSACTKSDFLNKKPRTNLVVPTTLDDFQALLDNDVSMNISPALCDQSADNYYLQFDFWQSQPPKERNSYTWAKDIYEGGGNIEDWNLPYKQVFTANVVLEGIKKIPVTETNRLQWEQVKGSALFFRGHAFFQLASAFAPAYDAATAQKDYGIPVRLVSDINEKAGRGTLQQTFDQLLKDLHEAGQLLPEEFQHATRNRPSLPAATALLSRVYMYMHDYEKGGLYADSSLRMYKQLIDYNTIVTALFPFTRLNEEVLFQCKFSTSYTLVGVIAPGTIVDSTLVQSYAANDLRPAILFRKNSTGDWSLGGSYAQAVTPFSGLATDEVYLNRAECYARAGKVTEAMEDLNELLSKRFPPASFVPYTAANKEDALQLVLEERRKEMPFRGIRFTDLKRLNKEGYNIRLKRILDGHTYELAPNDPRYALPVPQDEINISGIPQNPR